MMVLAALIPILMLGVVLALGRYEELMLSEQEDDRREPAALVGTWEAVQSPRV